MSTIWITPELATPGEYSYNATICDDTLKVWLHLRSTGFRGQYELEMSAEKRHRVRGNLGARQKEQARALRAELEPLFINAMRAAGWTETTDPIIRRTVWVRA